MTSVTVDELNALLNKFMKGCFSLVVFGVILNHGVCYGGNWFDSGFLLFVGVGHIVTFSTKL